LVPEHLKAHHRAGIARYAETGHGPYIESPRPLGLPALRKGGKEIYVELSLSPIGLVGDADGSERYVLAFARYTIRTLATRESRPSTVLSGLNEAMLRQRRERGDHKFCTVAYVRLETDEGNAERGARNSVSRGGRSPPFLLKGDGSI